MTTTLKSPPVTTTSTPPGGASAAFALELCEEGGSVTSKRVPLATGAKLTIGGGPKCDLRLQGVGVRPLHCVVTATDEGPIARRWAEGTLLNGSPFTEAVLAIGDRLEVAGRSIRLALLESPNAAPPTPPAPRAKVEVPAGALDREPRTVSSAAPVQQAQPIQQEEVGAAIEAIEASPALAGLVRQPESEPTRGEFAPNRGDDDSFDPAVPSRLLRPWTPCSPSPAPHDDASASTEASIDWGLPETTLIDVEPSHHTAPAKAVPPTEFAPAPMATANERATPNDPKTDGVPANASPATDPDSLAARVASGRRRVAALVAALRLARAEARTLGERSDALTTARDAAILAAEQAASQLAALAERLAATELGRNEADAIASQTQADLVVLQQRVAELEKSLAGADRRTDALPTAIASPARESMEASLDPFAGALDTPENEFVEPAAPATEAQVAWDTPEAIDDAPVAWGALDETGPDPFAADPESSRDEDPFAGPSASEAPAIAVSAENAAEANLQQADEPWEIELQGAATQGGDPLWGRDPAAPLAEEPAATTAPAREVAAPSIELADGEGESYSPPARVAEQLAALVGVEARDEDAEVAATAASVAAPAMDVAPTAAPPTTLFDAEPADKPAFRPPTGSFIERFAHLVPDEQQPLPEAQRVEAPPVFDAPPRATDHGDDDSIDDYMKKMMERIRGDGPAPAPRADAPKPATAIPVAAVPIDVALATEEASVEAPTPTVAPPVAPLTNLEELRGATAAERGTDMTALRQLANQSARDHIDVADVNTRKERSTLGLVVAGVALVCGAFASMMAPEVLSEQFFGGLIGVAFGGAVWMRVLKSLRAPKRKVTL
ncbi:MAG: hypothetical protein ACRCT8_01010 [Lacipirellulaceae bacterium]